MSVITESFIMDKTHKSLIHLNIAKLISDTDFDTMIAACVAKGIMSKQTRILQPALSNQRISRFSSDHG